MKKTREYKIMRIRSPYTGEYNWWVAKWNVTARTYFFKVYRDTWEEAMDWIQHREMNQTK